MKTKLFVAREIQYFEFGIFSFNSHVYYLTRGFIASTRAFNLLTRAFNLATRAFSVLTDECELVTRELELVTRELELVTRGFELVTRRFELVTRNSCFTFPRNIYIIEVLKFIHFGSSKRTCRLVGYWPHIFKLWIVFEVFI